MSQPRQADLERLIVELIEGGVELIVVGGAAAVLQGAPTTTLDLDIVHRRTQENVERLLRVLGNLDARFRDPLGRVIRPEAAQLLGSGQLNLSTDFGPLDALCVLHDGRGYDELVGHTDLLEDGAVQIRVLDLPTLIEVKADIGRAKDRLVVPILLAILQQRESGTE